ncbi:MAG: NAD(P)/FAD-dependent oxidoreductase [Devosiaceae bacterium]|nr:NAD(P)/FAD-dependent oxidoreductase [Devosiaceae bacterium]
MQRFSNIKNNPFIGQQINLEKPISFLVNNIKIEGFEGDCVLSAILASGFDCAGTHLSFPVTLDEYLNLPVSLITKGTELDIIAPVQRMPAINGAIYNIEGVNVGTRISNLISRLKKEQVNSLNINFDEEEIDFHPPTKQVDIKQISVELLIIGGGLAGLSAAKYGATICNDILLLEQQKLLGGDAVLFGNNSDEEKSEKLISDLIKSTKKTKNIEIKTSSAVIKLKDNIALVQRLSVFRGKLKQEVFEVSAKKIVLATGCVDRLSIFNGNRICKTMGLGAIFRLASSYGIFPKGQSSIITNNNAAYRMALLAADAGAKIEKIFDVRIEPKSRFIEFAKSYGIKLETGLMPIELKISDDKKQLHLEMGLVWEDRFGKKSTLNVDNIILSAGWLANLDLWLQAGGDIISNESSSGIKAQGKLKNISIAGSNSGWRSNFAIMQSGVEAINYLFRKKMSDIVEKRIDALFETPIGFAPIHKENILDAAPKYYDFGNSLICKHSTKSKNIWSNISLGNKIINYDILNNKAFSLGDICALNNILKLSKSQFEQIVRERAIKGEKLFSTAQEPYDVKLTKVKPVANIPNYLQERYGKDAQVWEITSLENMSFEVGQLIFANSDVSNPEQALGSIIYQSNELCFALIIKHKAIIGQQISIYASGGHSLAKLLNPH